MATSLTPVSIPADTWVDLYNATGITIGVQLIVQNIGNNNAKLSESLAEPIQSTGHNVISPGGYLTNSLTAVGAWGYSGSGTSLQVEED